MQLNFLPQRVWAVVALVVALLAASAATAAPAAIDTPEVRGQVRKVAHLVSVEE